MTLPPVTLPPIDPKRPAWLGEPISAADRVSPAYARLLGMFTWCRPHKSAAEAAFAEAFIDALPGVWRDGFGNRIVAIPQADGTASRVLWSCHIDTVHKTAGRQRIRVAKDFIRLHPDAPASCLGADDTAGVWLMQELIAARVPGRYVFHRGEEVGGLGSAYIVRETPELLDGIVAAIAFDRKGYDSVVTSQYEDCASDAFADSLAAMLDLKFWPDPSGTFTDTANYIGVIPECTNLSVGYFHAHSRDEYLDARFVFRLRDALLSRFREAALVIARDPADAFAAYDPPQYSYDAADDSHGDRYAGEAVAAIRDNPEAALELLADCGVSVGEVLERCGWVGGG